jgi:uncharacterized repeat protein (TIGR03803 family)
MERESAHNFSGKDGSNPYAALIVDAAGNLYGTTVRGGAFGLGTVFELVPQAEGRWKKKVLHNFAPVGHQGSAPSSSLIFDAAGNLYGTTVRSNDGFGTVFKIVP